MRQAAARDKSLLYALLFAAVQLLGFLVLAACSTEALSPTVVSLGSDPAVACAMLTAPVTAHVRMTLLIRLPSI